MEGLLEEQPAGAPVEMGMGEALPADPSTPVDNPEEDVSPEAAPLLDKAINNVYSDQNLPKLQKLFQEAGPEGFPKAMGLAIAGGMSGIDGSDEVVAEVGSKLFEMVTEDLIESGEVQGVTPEMITQAAGEAISMWAQRNPERFNKEEFAQLLQQEIQTSDIDMGGAQPPQGAPMVPPAAEGLLGA